ncbi:MAG: MFS transporter [Spirochaetales bacterium]|nr:MFS transporter [Spirochaetales bacterium]
MRQNVFLLKVYALIGLHRGEEQRVLAFLMLQFAVSIIIGLLSTGIDPMFLNHTPDMHELYFVKIIEDAFEMHNAAAPVSQLSAALLSVSSLIMVIGGFWYSGFTDKVDKRKIGLVGISVFFIVCTAFGLGIMIHNSGTNVPFLYSGLYVFRFLAGIFLLITFWDTINLFFNPREARRLFPLVATGGALGYSVGCLLVIPIEFALPSQWVLFTAAILGFIVFLTLKRLQNHFVIVAEPRYRNTSAFREIREGLRQLWDNPFLRSLAMSTLVFGLLSGIVMFAYNSIVTELRSQNTTVSVMALQRAAVTLLQAFIITRLMSQTGLGKKQLKEGIILQTFILFLGFFVYIIDIISMVGVADFTRQVEVALMSPAFMSSLMIIPLRYRGRVMALNNLLIAPFGMAVASFSVYLLRTKIPLVYFIYPLVFLIFLRLAYNFIVSRKYLDFIKDSFSLKRKVPLESVLEHNLFKNREIVSTLMNNAGAEDRTIQALVWGKLADKVTDKADFAFLNKWKPRQDDVMYASWLRTAGRLDYENFSTEIEKAGASEIREIRIASLETEVKNINSRLEEIRIQLVASLTNGGNYDDIPAEVLFRIADPGFVGWYNENWNDLPENARQLLFPLVKKYPDTASRILLEGIIAEGACTSGMARSYAAIPGLTADDVSLLYEKLGSTGDRIQFIHGIADNNNDICNSWLLRILFTILDELTSADQNSWAQSMQRQLEWSGEKNRVLVRLVSIMLEKEIPGLKFRLEKLELARKEIIKTISCLYQVWYDCSQQNHYLPLLAKWFGSDANELLQLLLLVSAFPLRKADNRLAVREIALGVGGEKVMSINRQHDELISLLDPAVRAVFLIMTEESSLAEKAVNLKRFSRGFFISFDDLMQLFSENCDNCQNPVKRELITVFSGKKD